MALCDLSRRLSMNPAQIPDKLSRRSFLTRSLAATAVSLTAVAGWSDELSLTERYPDPRVKALDPRFGSLIIGNTPLLRIHHGNLWAEGPAWSGAGQYLVWSDIPANLQRRWLAEDGHVSEFRRPSGKSNGNTFDREGRQISCQHLHRRVVRYEADGTEHVLADRFDGKPLNGPNDVVVHPKDGAIWFTDAGYGLNHYEGQPGELTQKESIYRIDAGTGRIDRVTDDIFKPNGLCFSPDCSTLYVADTGRSHYAEAPFAIMAWDVRNNDSLTGRREFASTLMDGFDVGFVDGIRADVHGNIWAGAGWAGEGYDGVHVFAPDGERIGQILLPEICSNVCFGGPNRDRLFMTASQSVYAMYVNTQGAPVA
jgi:gluconolactonase